MSRLALPAFSTGRHVKFVLSREGKWLVANTGLLPFKWTQANPNRRFPGALAEPNELLVFSTADGACRWRFPCKDRGGLFAQVFGDLLFASGVWYYYSDGIISQIVNGVYY